MSQFYMFFFVFVVVRVYHCALPWFRIATSFPICKFAGKCVFVCFLRLCLPLHSFSLFIIIIFGFGIDTIRSKRHRLAEGMGQGYSLCIRIEANRVDIRRTRIWKMEDSIELNVGLSAQTITVITSINLNATFSPFLPVHVLFHNSFFFLLLRSVPCQFEVQTEILNCCRIDIDNCQSTLCSGFTHSSRLCALYAVLCVCVWAVGSWNVSHSLRARSTSNRNGMVRQRVCTLFALLSGPDGA